jgi:hypothetical protein
LLDVLLKRVRRKRDFEAAFSSPEGAETFAKGAGLSDKQKHLLLAMQNQRILLSKSLTRSWISV